MAKLTLDRIMDGVERTTFGLENVGFCTACGAENEGCEPDMRNGTCESCGAEKVFGAEELLTSMGGL